jgi:hypothetical protein
MLRSTAFFAIRLDFTPIRYISRLVVVVGFPLRAAVLGLATVQGEPLLALREPHTFYVVPLLGVRFEKIKLARVATRLLGEVAGNIHVEL